MKDEKLNKILKHILNLNKELNSKYVFDKKHNFMFIDTTRGQDDMIFKNAKTR